ncbi:MAG: FAD-containing oxidoreductase [Gammaproteobacteria bacterium]|nr:FAD-containing oxidoreductase [Gammaproteobacteria bacterium]
MIQYDAIVIGTGQAGPSMATRLASSGLKTAIIESGKFGGTCVNNGCIPTKTMVASARAAHVARHAIEYGVVIEGSVVVDMKLVKARKDEISAKSNNGVEQWLKGTENLTVYLGKGKFESNNTVRVGDELLQADKIFINVGGHALVPDFSGLDNIDYLTNENIMELDYLPEHLIIIGGSYIGLEFAQMYRRFGSKVTVIEKSATIIQREDEDVSNTILQVLEREGVEFRLNAECISPEKQGDEVVVKLDCEQGSREVRGSHLLLAVGRVPNTEDLGLEKTDIEIDARGYIKVDDQLQTTVPGVWALGDCNGQGAFTHTSYNDYEIVAANILDNDPRKVSDRILTYGLFVDPPLGRVGMTERQARESGRNVLIGQRPMTRIGRAVENGQTDGFMKILVDADSKEILGAAIIGLNGDEVIHSIIDIMYAKAPYTVIQRAVHIHPTVSELIPTMLGELKPL